MKKSIVFLFLALQACTDNLGKKAALEHSRNQCEFLEMEKELRKMDLYLKDKSVSLETRIEYSKSKAEPLAKKIDSFQVALKKEKVVLSEKHKDFSVELDKIGKHDCNTIKNK